MEWLRHGRTRNEVESPKEVYQRFQMLGRGFEAFCLLLTIRSLEQLGVEPTDNSLTVSISARSGLTIDLNWGLSVSAATDGCIELGSQGSTLLRIVPIPATLSSVVGDVETSEGRAVRKKRSGPPSLVASF